MACMTIHEVPPVIGLFLVHFSSGDRIHGRTIKSADVMNRAAVAAPDISPVIHSYADEGLVLRCRRSETETASSHVCLRPACCLRSMSRQLNPPCGAPRSVRDRAPNVRVASNCPSDEKVQKSNQFCSLRFRFRYPQFPTLCRLCQNPARFLR